METKQINIKGKTINALQETIIAPGLTVIPTGSLSIEQNVYKSLVRHCQRHNLNPKHLYLYVSEGDIMAGFSPDFKHHVKLHYLNWKPIHEC